MRALELAERLGAQRVDLFLDSKLIVEQLHGRWRVKDAKLQPLWAEAQAMLAGFRRWSATHVPRAQNSTATGSRTRRSTGAAAPRGPGPRRPGS